ncbi:hypothetical protein PV797_07510 [Clostridiaceae bacterium M8S5]|nr:hypothetical protein PV797_07510 [Clostridiaceae bacterium M8S5]
MKRILAFVLISSLILSLGSFVFAESINEVDMVNTTILSNDNEDDDDEGGGSSRCSYWTDGCHKCNKGNTFISHEVIKKGSRPILEDGIIVGYKKMEKRRYISETYYHCHCGYTYSIYEVIGTYWVEIK